MNPLVLIPVGRQVRVKTKFTHSVHDTDSIYPLCTKGYSNDSRLI